VTSARGTAGDSRGWLPAVLLVDILCFLPALLQAGLIRVPLPKASESTGLFYPWNIFWRDEVSAGRLPFWNPFMFGGLPNVAEPQAQTFYPSHLLWLIFDPELAFKLAFLLHILIASWLMYRLVRALGGNRFGAAIAGLVYGLHGQMVAFITSGWIHQVAPMALAPGVLWMLCRAYKDPRRFPGGPIFGAGAFLGLQVLSGHPEWVRYTLFIVALLTLGARAYQPSMFRRVAISAGAVGLGLLISGIQLLPLAQATLQSPRGQSAIESGVVRSGAGLPVLTLPTILVPRLFGPWDPAITVDGLAHKLSGSLVNFAESLVYVGVLPLALVFIAWRRRRDVDGHGRRSGAGVWLFIAVTGVLFAMQDLTRLQSLLDFFIPLDSTFRSPARFVFLTNLALAVLAGLGASRLHDAKDENRGLARAGFAIAAVLVAGGLTAYAFRSPLVSWALEWVQPPATVLQDAQALAGGVRGLGLWAMTNAAHALLISAGLVAASSAALLWASGRLDNARRLALAAIVAGDLALYDLPFLTNVVRADAVYAQDVTLLSAISGNPAASIAADRLDVLTGGDNVTMMLRVRSLLGYDSFFLAEWDRLWRAVSTGDAGTRAAAGVTHVVDTDATGRRMLRGVPGARGHAWWTDRVEYASSPDEAIALLPRLSTEGGVALETSAQTASMLGAGSGNAIGALVTVEEDVPGRLRAFVNAPRAGWLVFTEVIYPGWTAQVDGVDAPIARAFGAIQAVQVPAGPSRVHFVFRPVIVWWGAAMSALGLLAGVVLVWFTAPASRYREYHPPAESR
jgi:hypothetical protein